MNRDSLIYVSGHSGLLGSAVVQKLGERGYRNLLLCPHIRECNPIASLELLDWDAVNTFFYRTKPEYVFHCAAKIGGIMATSKYQADFLWENLMINAHVIKGAQINGVKRMIVPGSVCTFPKDCPVPIKEEYALTGAFEPTCEGYAIAKMSSLFMVKYFNELYGTNFLTTNLCNLYGDNDCWDSSRNHVIPALIEKFHNAKRNNLTAVTLMGTGIAEREFMHADDAADVLVRLMECPVVSQYAGGVVNIGGGESVNIRELAKIISEVIGYEGEILFDGDDTKDGALKRRLDTTMFRQVIDWSPKIALKDGIIRMYQHYSNR